MDGIVDNPAIFFLVAGLILLGIDIFVIGLSPLMFVAAGAVTTGALLFLTGWKSGVLYLAGWQPGFLGALAICAAISLALAITGKRPLQKFQNANIREDQSSDLIGRELVTTQEVTKTDGWVFWSGTQWQARLEASARTDHVGPGVRMQVVEVKNLALILHPLE
ncbi:MAG TPA: NfeD family protein [Methylocella sp.]|jgi:inner membrane protein|nr:NfeD family protein [Methylocella sp.]